MARSQLEFQALLETLEGPEEVYFQPPTTLVYPCIKYEIDEDYVSHADNVLYWDKNRYSVTVIDRNPNSLIPRQVRALPYSRFDRKFVKDNLHHTVYQIYF